MPPAASHNHGEKPVIWLLAPEALKPAPDPIRPMPITISATLVTVIFLTLIVVYNKKLKPTSAERKSIELENLKASIRVIRPVSTSSATFAPPCSHPARMAPTRPARLPPQSHVEGGWDTISEPQVKKHHDAPKDILDVSCNSSPIRPPSRSTTGSYHFSPRSMTVVCEEAKASAHVEQHVLRPPSSVYSTLQSHHNSVRNREINAAWTRLHSGSEYDGDRTFVQSETNLQLCKRKDKATED